MLLLHNKQVQSKKQVHALQMRWGKRRRLEIARLMLRSGEPVEKIKRYTGLSDATLRGLQQK
jgi:transposase-like protein